MNGSSWLSSIQIIDSTILGVRLDINDGYRGPSPDNAQLTIAPSFGEVEEMGNRLTCRCVLEVSHIAASADNHEDEAFRISCTLGILVGIEKSLLPDGQAPDNLRFALAANAFSLGFGKARYFIESLALQSPVGKVLLPAVDAREFMKLVEEEWSQ